MKPMEYEEWYNLNESEAYIYAAETGADHELDYDSEAFFEALYESYLKTGHTWYHTELERDRWDYPHP